MRLTSWNLLHGQGAKNITSIADELCVGKSDFVIGIQEVDAFQDRSDQSFQTAELASALGAKYFAFARCVIGTPGFKWRALKRSEEVLITNDNYLDHSVMGDKPPSYGVGLITNIPVKSWKILTLGRSLVGLPLLFPAPDSQPGDKKRAKLMAIYVKDEPRYAIAAQLENGYTIVNVHLSFVPIVNLIQLFRVKRWLGKMPGEHILLGDLNLPFNIPVKLSRWRSLVDMASYPTWQPKIQFDYILSKTLAGREITPIFIKSKISDHLPVTIEIN